jgi:hypothetical protein
MRQTMNGESARRGCEVEASKKDDSATEEM